MSNTKKVIQIGLDYSEFTGGISDINSKMTLLNSEFKRASAEADAYGSETDKTRINIEKLTQQINLQAQKVEISRKAYEKAKEEGKLNEKQLDKLKTAYNSNQTQLLKLSNELKNYKNEQKDASKSAESFGDAIRSMASSIGINVNPAIESLATKFDGVSKATGTAIIGIAAIGTAFVKCSKDAADFADDLLTLSSTTGIATDELQKMQYASKFLDVDVSTMTNSMTKLTKNMDNARRGSQEQEEAFKKLGIRYKSANGELKDVNTVFYEVIDRLGKVKNETERDALAMNLLGKSAKELNPLIEAGSDRLKELGIEAENMGTVMSQENLNKLGRLKDSMDKLDNVSDSLKNSLGLALVPVLTALFEVIGKIPVPVLQTLVILASAVTGILLVVKAIKSLTDTGKAIKTFFTGFSASTLKTTAIVLGVVAALIALGTIISVIAGKGNQLNQAMASVGDSVSKVTGTVNNAQTTVRQTQYHASGTLDYAGGRTWVGEAGPELIELPKHSKIYSNAESQQMAGKDNYYITMSINASSIKEFEDVINIVKGARMQARRA